MAKFVAYQKLSKKATHALDQKKRRTWQGLSPVTRMEKNPRAYDRNAEKSQMRKDVW